MTLVTSNTFDANGMVSGAGSDPQRKQTQGQYNKHHHQIKNSIADHTLWPDFNRSAVEDRVTRNSSI